MEADQILRDTFLARIDGMEADAHKGVPPDTEDPMQSVDSQIRHNVTGVLRRMFGVYFAYVFEGRQEGPRPIWIDPSLSGSAQLDCAFIAFVDDLMERWSAKAGRDELFGRDGDCHKERVKISTAMRVRQAFQECRADSAAMEDSQ